VPSDLGKEKYALYFRNKTRGCGGVEVKMEMNVQPLTTKQGWVVCDLPFLSSQYSLATVKWKCVQLRKSICFMN
jgi:hypothetical protein